MSDQNTAEALAGLIQWLRERHDRIMAVEAEALRLLESGDTPRPQRQNARKSRMLAALGEDAKPLLAGLPANCASTWLWPWNVFRAAPAMRWASIRSFTCPPCSIPRPTNKASPTT